MLAPARTDHRPGRHRDTAAARVLPLGSGLMLLGLGMALALAGLRLRRG
ncbi:hypothetical protein [Streptomyces sp. WMMC905]